MSEAMCNIAKGDKRRMLMYIRLLVNTCAHLMAARDGEGQEHARVFFVYLIWYRILNLMYT